MVLMCFSALFHLLNLLIFPLLHSLGCAQMKGRTLKPSSIRVYSIYTLLRKSLDVMALSQHVAQNWGCFPDFQGSPCSTWTDAECSKAWMKICDFLALTQVSLVSLGNIPNLFMPHLHGQDSHLFETQTPCRAVNLQVKAGVKKK